MRAREQVRVRRWRHGEYAVFLPATRHWPADWCVFEIHDTRHEAELCAQAIVAVRSGKASATKLPKWVRT
jgi:hypothetical protein